MNLCTNAFHAMEAKGGTLTISLHKNNLSQDDLATEPDLQPGTFVQLSIRDIPLFIAEIIDKLAQSLFRLDLEEFIKGTVGGDHPEVMIQGNQGFAHSVDDALCEFIGLCRVHFIDHNLHLVVTVP